MQESYTMTVTQSVLLDLLYVLNASDGVCVVRQSVEVMPRELIKAEATPLNCRRSARCRPRRLAGSAGIRCWRQRERHPRTSSPDSLGLLRDGRRRTPCHLGSARYRTRMTITHLMRETNGYWVEMPGSSRAPRSVPSLVSCERRSSRGTRGLLPSLNIKRIPEREIK
jgi:hypothetical protein